MPPKQTPKTVKKHSKAQRRHLFRLVGLFIAMIALVTIMVWFTLNSGKTVIAKANTLATKLLPEIASIAELQNTMHQCILSLHQYYAYDTLESFQENIDACDEKMGKWIDDIRRQSSDNSMKYLLGIEKNFLLFQNHANSFSNEMQGERDWDKIRASLFKSQKTASLLEANLLNMHNAVQNEVEKGSASTLSEISKLNFLQLSFSLITLLIAALALLAFYRRMVDIDLMHKLSIFPERNPSPVLRTTVNREIDYINPAANALITSQKIKNASGLLPESWQEVFEKENIDNLQKFEQNIGNRVFKTTIHFLPDIRRYHIFLDDITELVFAERELVHRSLHDELTQLPNRKMLEKHLGETISLTKGKNHITIYLLTLDKFTLVNGTHGHMVGDRLLKSISDWLERLIQENHERAILYRFSNSSWAIMHLGSLSKEHEEAFGKSILKIAENPIDLADREISVTCSIGITRAPQEAENVNDILRNADAASRMAKDRGGACLQFYQESIRKEAEEWLTIENALRHAITANEFELYFQIKVDAKTKKPIASEVLLRWHRNGQMVSPAVFIPIAEESGLIEPIGDWVLEAACRQWKQWETEGFPLLSMAVNISSQQFQRIGFASYVGEVIKSTQMNSKFLELEITEAVAVDQPERIVDTMNALKKNKISIAIDDFGTGYSSLSYLKKFPLDTLKIDQSFVRQIEHSNDAAIARLVLSLGHELGYKVVAEGVETEAQAALLDEWGCDILQGYLFSKPLPADKFKQFVLEQLKDEPKDL